MWKVTSLCCLAVFAIAKSAVVSESKVSAGKPAVFLGDSITQGWYFDQGLPIWMEHYDALTDNQAISGHITDQTIDRIVNGGVLDGLDSKLAVLLIGTNDLSYGIPETTVAGNIAIILDLIRARIPGVQILLLGILPRGGVEIAQRAENVNALISAYGNNPDVTFLNMIDQFQVSLGNPIPSLYDPDLLHLVRAGYQRWHEIMWPYFEEVVKPEPVEGKPAVFLGDSITQGWYWEEGLPIWMEHYDALTDNQAISGHITNQTIDRIVNGKVLDGLRSKLAVLLIGTNDLSYGVPETAIAANIAIILDLIREKIPGVHILLLGILPRGGVEVAQRAENVNALISAYASSPDVHFINLRNYFQISLGNPIPALYNPDLLHLVRAGYQRWHEIMWPYFSFFVNINMD